MVTLIRYLGFALTLVWVSNVVPRPPTKRAAAIGIVNGFGNLGNLYVISLYSRSCNDVENLMSTFYLVSGHMLGKPRGALSTISRWKSALLLWRLAASLR